MAAPSPAQAKAIRLAASGQYRYEPKTGGARHFAHRPGTPAIARRTLVVLIKSGLAEWDPLCFGHLRLTDKGREALREIQEKWKR